MKNKIFSIIHSVQSRIRLLPRAVQWALILLAVSGIGVAYAASIVMSIGEWIGLASNSTRIMFAENGLYFFGGPTGSTFNFPEGSTAYWGSSWISEAVGLNRLTIRGYGALHLSDWNLAANAASLLDISSDPNYPTRTRYLFQGTAGQGDANVYIVGSIRNSYPTGVFTSRTSDWGLGTSGVWTAIPFNTEYGYDVDSYHDVLVQPDRIKIVDIGPHMVTCSANFSADPTGVRMLEIRRYSPSDVFLNTIARAGSPAVTGGFATNVQVTALWNFAAGEYVRCWAYQNSGISLTIVRYADFSPRFDALRVP